MNDPMLEKIVNMTFPMLGTQETLSDFLRGILSGNEGIPYIHLRTFLALRQAQNRQITLREFIAAIRGEITDPLYKDLVCAIDRFLQSNSVSDLHGESPSAKVARYNHPMIGTALASLSDRFESTLSDEEKAALSREAREHKYSSCWLYIKDYLLQRIRE